MGQNGQILLPLPICINTVARSISGNWRLQMPSIKNTEDNASRFGLLSGSALWSLAARQTRISLETQSTLLKNYEVVSKSWIRHRQQDVAEGLRICEAISGNPDASNAITVYQKWASNCMNRWVEDIEVLRSNLASMASRVQEVSQEAATTLETSQDTAPVEAAKRPAR
jgi:hypothetical protein